MNMAISQPREWGVAGETIDGLHRLSYADGFQDIARRVELLAPGETLKISTPDFAAAAAKYQERDGSPLPAILGVEMPNIDAPAAWYDKTVLAELMRQAGLVDIHTWKREPFQLCLAGNKPLAPVEPPHADLKIAAVMSLPRYGQNSFWGMAFEALAPLGIPLMDGRSPFWDQCMQRTIGIAIAQQEPDVILTLDYDTPPRTSAILALKRVLQEHPEIDAVVPLQCSRHNHKPLFSIEVPEGVASLDVIPPSVFQHPLTPITRGHFGCTLFRTSALRKLPKPWFQTIPDANGEFEEGRMDPDVFFWKQFVETGLKPALANRIIIGHTVEMVAIPGPDFRPIYITPEEYRERFR